MGSRAPAPPEADSVERQFGVNADLYAEVRADTAKALGFDDEAEVWDRVKSEVNDRDTSRDGRSEADDQAAGDHSNL
jgi:hypothetical protein